MEPAKDTDDLLRLRTWTPEQLAPPADSTHNYFEGNRFVKELSPEDFDHTSPWKLKDNKCAIVLFYKPACPYCQDVKPQWEQLGETAAFFNVYALNSEKYKAYVAKINEEKPRFIVSYPTIVIYEEGTPLKHYEGPRDWKHLAIACAEACTGDFEDQVRDMRLLLLPEEELAKMYV